VLGGYVNNTTPSAQILRFDATSNQLANIGALPAPLTDAAATVVSGTAYLVGGEGPGRATTANVETLTPR
jgi:N-acetylneuraminic acid mutarotase